MHEDDWRQLEFYANSRRTEIERLLRELKIFEKQHRKGSGWDAIFVRKLPPAPALRGSDALHGLSDKLNAVPRAGPILFYGSTTITGRVANGFSIEISKGLFLYGVSAANGIEVLGAAVDGGDLELTKVFSTLNKSDGLILVDWRSQMLITGVAADGNLIVWKP
jgi:hypothetical protein